MTKAIKFNLTLDNYPVRDLDDLKEHFNLDDLLTTYHNKLLHRWLAARGLQTELKQLDAIANRNDDQSVARDLCSIFQINLTDDEIGAIAYPLQLQQQEQQRLKQLEEQQFKRDAVITDYHAGYEKLCWDMLECAEDYPFIKSAINTLSANYSKLLVANFESFFDICMANYNDNENQFSFKGIAKNHFKERKSPLILFAMLANESYREYDVFSEHNYRRLADCIPNPYTEVEGDKIVYKGNTNSTFVKITDEKVIVKKMSERPGADGRYNVLVSNEEIAKEVKGYGEISNAIGIKLNNLYFFSGMDTDFVEYVILKLSPTKSLPKPYKVYAGATEGYWKDLEPKGTKCLILTMKEGNVLRNAAKSGEELTAADIDGQFLLLDGIDYKSNNADHALIYMVV